MCGTASDTGGSGLAAVEVRIQRQSDSHYWNGTSWQTGAVWLPATGTSPWSRGFTPGDDQYTLSSRATDAAGNVESTDTATFTVDITAPATALDRREQSGLALEREQPEADRLRGVGLDGPPLPIGRLHGIVMAAGPAVDLRRSGHSAPPCGTTGRTSSR